jgi:outer membrane protein TolC
MTLFLEFDTFFRHSDMFLKRILLLVCLISGYAQHSYGAESSESGRPLTLAKALALTLEHSPELSAFSWDIRSAEARIIQAKLIPNPEISVEGENLSVFSGSQSGNEMQDTLRLSQLLSWVARDGRGFAKLNLIAKRPNGTIR